MLTGELAGQIVRLEFSISNQSFPFVGASVDGGQTVLEQLIPRGDGIYDEFYSVRNVPPDRVRDLVEEYPNASARTLARYDDGGLVKITIDDRCLAVFLAEQGAVPRRVEGVDGAGYVHVEVPADEAPDDVAERVLAEYPSADLRSKRQQERSTPLFTCREVEHAVLERLTDRQREVLLTAVEAGYYEWPREVSGEELAERLDLSGATLHEHLRRAESALVTTLFARSAHDPEAHDVGYPAPDGPDRGA